MPRDYQTLEIFEAHQLDSEQCLFMPTDMIHNAKRYLSNEYSHSVWMTGHEYFYWLKWGLSADSHFKDAVSQLLCTKLQGDNVKTTNQWCYNQPREVHIAFTAMCDVGPPVLHICGFRLKKFVGFRSNRTSPIQVCYMQMPGPQHYRCSSNTKLKSECKRAVAFSFHLAKNNRGQQST